MNKTQAKQLVKKDPYKAVIELCYMKGNECEDLKEILFRVFDNIPDDVWEKAIRKGTR